MSRRKRRKKEKSRKKLAYGVIVVASILICFVAYRYLNPLNQTTSDQNSSDQTLPPKAAIVDHLSFREETKNESFVNASKNILEEAGFAVDYYPGEEVNVTFYRNLLGHGYGLIILRVHSALIGESESLGLFTSEPFDESKFDNQSSPYFWDVYHNRLVEAYFTEEERARNESYFAIAPKFVEKYGDFQNTLIIIMGCDGLKYNITAEAFRSRGAKVCIGWDGLVSTPHTDHATTHLLQHLAQRKTVEKAVENTMKEVGPEEMYFQDQGYKSTLEYYLKAAGSYIVKFTLDASIMDNIQANTVLVKEKKKGTKLNWL